MNKIWLFIIIIIESTILFSELFAGGEPTMLAVKTMSDETFHQIKKELLLQSHTIKNLLEEYPDAGTVVSSAIHLHLPSEEFNVLKSYLQQPQRTLPDDIIQLGPIAHSVNYLEVPQFLERVIEKAAQVLILPENLKKFLKDEKWINTVNYSFNQDLKREITKKIIQLRPEFIGEILNKIQISASKTLLDTNFVDSFAVTPDGQIASGAWDDTIKIRDRETGTLRITLIGHSCSVYSVAITPDGQIVSGSFDKTIKIWNIKILKQIEQNILNSNLDQTLLIAVQILLKPDVFGGDYLLSIFNSFSPELREILQNF